MSASPATGKVTCTNDNGSGKKAADDTQPLAVSGNVATAICDLQPGWFIVTKPTSKSPRSRGSWQVTGSLLG